MPIASAVCANRSSAYLRKMSPSTGDAYSDAFSPELARSWSAASHSLFCSSPRSVATARPSEYSFQPVAVAGLATATRKLPGRRSAVPVGARNPVAAGQAALRYSLMRPPQRVARIIRGCCCPLAFGGLVDAGGR